MGGEKQLGQECIYCDQPAVEEIMRLVLVCKDHGKQAVRELREENMLK